MPPVSEFAIQRAFCIWYGGEQRKDGTWKVVPAQLPGVVWWHTSNNAKRETGIESGFLVTECNHVVQFDFESLNYGWYVENAKKLVIS